MAVRAVAGTVTTTAAAISLVENESHDASNEGRDKGTSQLIKNTHASATFYVGGSDLTSANTATKGFPIAAGEVLATDLITDLDIVYAVCASGTSTYAVYATGA